MIRIPASKLSIRLSLPLLLSLLVIFTVSVVSIVGYSRARTAVRSLAAQNLEQIHERISERLSDQFEIPVRLNRVNLELIRHGQMKRAGIRQWRSVLFEQIRSFDSISSIVWGDARGRATFVSRYPGHENYVYGIRDEETAGMGHEFEMDPEGNIPTEPRVQYDFDPRARPWYRAAVEAGRPVWGDVYTWVMKKDVEPVLSVPYVAPLLEADGEVAGVMNVELSLFDVSRFLRTISIGDRGIAFIVNSDGELVASSTDAALFADSGRRLAAVESADPMISASAAVFMDGESRMVTITNYIGRTIEVRGDGVLVIASPFRDGRYMQWLIVTAVPVQEFLETIRRGRTQTILVGVLSIGLAILIGLVIAAYLARPIVQLSEHARRIGHGHLDEKLQLTEFPEFVHLSAAMNRMSEGLRERLKMRESLAMAMEVQQNLLPSGTPAVPGVQMLGHSDYCDETGGDYFDFLDMPAMPEDTAVIAIGDVSGHGIASAMVMAAARGILKSRCREANSLSGLLTHVNRQVVSDVTAGRFMTMLLVAVSAATGKMSWASAGHRGPLVYDAAANDFVEPEGGDVPLGVTDSVEYHEYEFGPVRTGHVILLATDGLWEAPGPGGEVFGMDRIREAIRAAADRDAESIRRRLLEAVDEFQGGTVQTDDLTFVVIKIAGG